MPPLRDIFGVVKGADDTLRIDKVTPELASPHSALHQGPLNVALEAAAIDELERSGGTNDFQVENWTILMVKPGMIGPFVASATALNARGVRVGVEATMTDQGSGGWIVATASSAFRWIGS